MIPDPVELPGARLGLLSDCHGDALITRVGVLALLQAGADAIIHLGDVCAPEVLDELMGLERADGTPVPVRVLMGNMDLDTNAMMRYGAALGVAIDDPIGAYRMAGKLIVAQHGHMHEIEALAARAGADFFLHGHTHRMRDEVVGAMHIVNPGALHRASTYTVATLDVATGDVEFIEVRKSPISPE